MGAEVIEKHFTIDNDLPGEIIPIILPNHLKDLSLFISNRKMLIDRIGFQDGEKDSRINYEGRFNG